MRNFCFLLCLTSVLLASCKKKPQKQNSIPVVAEQKIDSVQQNDTIATSIVEPDIVFGDTVYNDGNWWDRFKRDTIVGNYRIRHAIMYNKDKLIPQLNFNKEEPFYYRDTKIELEIEYNTKKILHEDITKDNFKDLLSWSTEFPNFQIVHISVAGVENEILSVEIDLCVPDTDNIEFYYLKISPDGEFFIENFIPEGAYADEDEEMREKMKKDSLERANSIQMEQAVHNDTLKVDSVVIGN